MIKKQNETENRAENKNSNNKGVLDMLSVPQNQKAEIVTKDQELPLMSSLMVNVPGVVDINKKSIPSIYLPHLYISHKDNKPMILKGQTEQELPEGVKIKHIVAIETVRQLRGKQYENRMKKSGVKEESMKEEWDDRVKKAQDGTDGWQHGTTNLVVVITPDGKCTFAAMETFKATESYMLELFKASTKKGMIAKINIKDHIINDKESKKGMPYLSSYKFNQWEIVPLTDNEIDNIKEAGEVQKDQIKKFLLEV